MSNIDITLLKEMMQLMRPEPISPIAPVLPIAPVHNEDALMANNIQYIQRDITEIKGTLKEITTTHVTISDFTTHVKNNEVIHVDHETRLRSVETSTNRILIWGSVILVLSTLAQLALKLKGI